MVMQSQPDIKYLKGGDIRSVTTQLNATQRPVRRGTVEMTQAEFNNLRRIFTMFDKNGNGRISVDELEGVLKVLGVPISIRETAVSKVKEETKEGDLDFDMFMQFVLTNKHIINHAPPPARNLVMNAVRTTRFLPDAYWRWVWDSIVLVAVSYFVIVVPLEWADLSVSGFMGFTLAMCILLLIDVLINLNTAFVDSQGRTILEWNIIIKNYLKGWFWIDLMSAIPLDLFVQSSGSRTAVKVLSCLHLLRLLDIHRLYQSSTLDYHIGAAYIRFNYHTVPIVRLLFWSLLVVHWTAILAYVLGIGDSSNTGTEKSPYLDALYWVLYTFSTSGYGDIIISTIPQKILSCVLFVASILISGVVVAKMAAMFRDRSLVQEGQHKMRETLNLLQHFNIPNPLRDAILAFQRHLIRHNISTSFAEVIEGLPKIMQDQLALYMRIAFISNVPLFQQASRETLISLAQRLQTVVVPPQEFIIVEGEEGQEMYFLGHGFAELLRGSNHLHTFQPGAFFGEIALLQEGVHRTASIRALTYCDLFILTKVDFNDILKRFPKFAETVKQEAERRLQTQNETRTPIALPVELPPETPVLGENTVVEFMKSISEEEQLINNTMNHSFIGAHSMGDIARREVRSPVRSLIQNRPSSQGVSRIFSSGGPIEFPTRKLAQLEEKLDKLRYEISLKGDDARIVDPTHPSAPNVLNLLDDLVGPGDPSTSRSNPRSELEDKDLAPADADAITKQMQQLSDLVSHNSAQIERLESMISQLIENREPIRHSNLLTRLPPAHAGTLRIPHPTLP